MRKLLVFLLLLGSGLLFLWWLERERAPTIVEHRPEPVTTAPEVAPDRGGLKLGGRFRTQLYEGDRTILTIESEDSRTEEGGDVLTGVELELLDPETEGLAQARLSARSGRMKRLTAESEFRPLWEKLVALEGVEAEFLSGTPLAPLSFEASEASIDLLDSAARKVSSKAAFSAHSRELTAGGDGFFIDLDRELLEVQHGGWVELARKDEDPVRFTSRGAGPLQVRREPQPGKIALEAWEGALIELFGKNPSTLAAEHVTARASSEGAPEGSMLIERLEAERNVLWESPAITFRAENSASASFDAEGRLERAHLEGFPRAKFALKLDPLALAGLPTEELREVELAGESALDIHWEDGYRLEMAAPASVETRDFRLVSGVGAVSGWLAEDQTSSRFSASGGVVLESGQARLETAAIEVAIDTGEPGATKIVGTATGGPRLEGVLPDGSAFTLTSPDSLSIERDLRGWRVVESSNVEVTLNDENGQPVMRARADRVRDFDATNFSFVAEGAIQFENPELRAGGERLRVFAAEPLHFELEGAAGNKAFIEGTGSRASADWVEFQGDEQRMVLRARGDASVAIDMPADASGLQDHYDFETEELFFERLAEAGLLAGEELRTYRLEATRGVEGRVESGEELLDLRCDRLFALGQERLRQGEEVGLELGSNLIAEGAVRAKVFLPEGKQGEIEYADVELELDCARLEVERGEGGGQVGFRRIAATEEVRFQARGGLELQGEGDRFEIKEDLTGTLEGGADGERVMIAGRLPSHGIPYRLTARRVDFARERIEALEPEFRFAGQRARAARMVADAQSVVLSGGVRAAGQTQRNVPWTLGAQELVILGRAPGEEVDAELSTVRATGKVDFRLGHAIRARGEMLSWKGTTGLIRLEGGPALFDTPFALIESDWVEFDYLQQILVSTGPGRARSRTVSQGDADTKTDWTLEFISSGTLLEMDSLVFALQEPVFRGERFDSVLRASWMVFWLDRELWKKLPDKDDEQDPIGKLFDSMKEVGTSSGGISLQQMLAKFRSSEISGLVREVYFEGPVELLSQDELLARADAIYLDAVAGHGWLARATVNLVGQLVGREDERLIVKADWLRLSADGTLRADRATVTSCTYDEPHVRVVTGDLRIQTLEGQGKASYRLLLKDNRIEMYDWLRIPLPRIDVATDEELEPLWPTLSIADSARFGTLFGFAFTRPAEKAGAAFNRAVGKKEDRYDSHYKVDAKYLGSRGGLLDLGLEIESEENYWFDLFVGLAYDDGDDKGFIRVDEEERDDLRRWLRSHTYFENGESVFSLVYSDQSDAGVQSEFFESQFVRYEQSESYAQWRRSHEEYFVQGSVKVRADGFRTDIEELPSVSTYRSRSPILSIGDLALIHTGDARAEFLRRREGSDPASPFGLPTTFPDGLGNRDVLRLDTGHQVELPMALGFAGLKLTPFAGAQVTFWDEGVDPEDSPSRFLADAGVRLGTTFWKRSGASVHQIAPSATYRAEIHRTENGGVPVAFDSLEQRVSGDFIELGARGRFGAVEGRSKFDVDVLATYATDRSDGVKDGWLPIEVFSRLDVEPFRRQIEFFLDGRFDPEDNRTVYSLFSAATRVTEDLRVQATHQRGLSAADVALFEAATVSGIYQWTEKWDFEVRQSFSLLEDEKLDARFLVRRYGHDIVVEFESSVREGEGSSIGLSIRPRFGFEPPRIGYVPW